jgi:ADP-glucose pyrophosphorylase
VKRVLAIILGGGAGTRLQPLTLTRAKPAVPLGGNYRLIDIPISNCINSGISKIYALTQFNSQSLNRHISLTRRQDSMLDPESRMPARPLCRRSLRSWVAITSRGGSRAHRHSGDGRRQY